MKKLLLASLLVLAACSTQPQTPMQAVYAVESNYAVALSIAVAYKRLPACGLPTSSVLCSDKDVVGQLQAADTAASTLLAAAQKTVRTPGAGANAQTAISAAEAAVQALTTITSTLKVN